jgi:hypothetical protein
MIQHGMIDVQQMYILDGIIHNTFGKASLDAEIQHCSYKTHYIPRIMT